MKIKSISRKHYIGKVHDIQVAVDHNYNVEGCVVHNSAAGSLVLYSMKVTNVDPIKYNLLFERFLDASRLDEVINGGGKISGCFSSCTVVKSRDRGYIEISDVFVGEYVLSIDGVYREVLEVFKHGVKEFYRVVYSDWLFFEATLNHTLPIIRDGEIIEVQVGDLVFGDNLITSDNLPLPFVSIQYSHSGDAYDLSIKDRCYYTVHGNPINEVVDEFGEISYKIDEELVDCSE